MHSLVSAQKVTSSKKALQALELREQGLTYELIGQAIGNTRQWARELVVHEMDLIAKEKAKLAENIIDLELLRLDGLWRAVWPQAMEGGLKAVGVCLKIQERRAKLLGLDAPVQTQEMGGDVELSIKLPEGWGVDPEPEGEAENE